jgi:predicted tellurium resistance membrane protein TerC
MADIINVLTSPAGLSALLALTVMEIILGIDNVIFISILASKLPEGQRDKARILGLGLAMLMRIALLFSISWLASLTTPLFTALGRDISGRDLILLAGGLFLIYKATREIHLKLEGEEHATGAAVATATFGGVITQILLLDIVFSLDSVLTAIGMADDLEVMVAAVVISVGVMLIASGPISRFVMAHPTVKMLALSFLLLIGTTLVAEGLHFHIDRGYIYGAMAFSVLVEVLNLRMSKGKKSKPVELNQPMINQSVVMGMERSGD